MRSNGVKLLRAYGRGRFQAFCKIHYGHGLCSANFVSTVHNGSDPSFEEILEHRNKQLTSYKAKIMAAAIPRIEKIEVKYHGRNIADDATMLMNRGLSTPYQCALHISQRLAKESIIALVKKPQQDEQESTAILTTDNDSHGAASSEILTLGDKESSWVPWDMHRPLEYDCELKFLKFQMELASRGEYAMVNEAYWKSCAVVLGAVAQQAFENDACVKLSYLPEIAVESGAFCYDIELSEALVKPDGRPKWKPNESTLISLTKVARQLIKQNYHFERIEIHKDDAVNIFSHDKRMLERLDNTFSTVSSPSHVPVYRFGNYLDVIDGPLIPSTSCLYHFVVTAVHHLYTEGSRSCLWRIQGLSLPKELQVHHAIWAMLEHRARKLIREDLPCSVPGHNAFNMPMHKYRSIENKTKLYNMATGQWLQDEWAATEEKIKIET